MLQTLLVGTSMLLYTLATGTLLNRMFHADGINFKKVLWLAGIAVFTHLVFVSSEIITPTGQDFSLINVVSLVCLIISGTVSIGAMRIPAPFLMSVVYGFSAFIQLLTLVFPKHVVVQNFFSNLPLTGHITLSLLAYSVLIIATLYAVQFQYINKKLKSKDLSIVSCHFPPLMQVERQLFVLLTVGTLLLSAALLSGFIYLDDMFSKSVAHKTILSIIAWVVYVALLLAHRFRGFRGQSAMITTIVGAVILTLAYFGSRFVREIILGRF